MKEEIEIANILNVSFNSIKKYDYNKPIDLVYTLMWLERYNKTYSMGLYNSNGGCKFRNTQYNSVFKR